MAQHTVLPTDASAGLSRRNFSRLMALGAAAIAAPKNLSATTSSSATGAMFAGKPPAKIIKLNGNENPLGPSKNALAAIAAVGVEGGRYLFAQQEALKERLASIEGVSKDQIQLFAGSSDPLHRAVLSFTSAEQSYVQADPSYEAGSKATGASGAKVIRVPLKADDSHDVKAMVAADPNAGLIYICNPNNPTGTLTAHDDIVWALEHKPAGALLLVDEAYIQYTHEQTLVPYVKTRDDIMVLKTFSKLYGMAGTRLGYVVAAPKILEKIGQWSGGVNGVSQHAVAAGMASLNEPGLIAERKAYADSVRAETFAFFRKNGYKYREAVNNMMMVNVGRPGNEVQAALAEKGILIGKAWPASPNEVRVSLGSHEEMRAFCAALKALVA